MWEDYVGKWWLIAMRGILAVIMGLLLIASPVKSLIVLATLVGVYLLIEGVVLMILSLTQVKKDDDWWVFFFQGLITLIIGWLIFALPQLTLAALVFLVAIWIFVVGIAMLFEAFQDRKVLFGGEWLLTAGAIVLLLISFALFSNPQLTLTLAAVLMGVVVLISGIFTTALGFQLKSFDRKLNKQLQPARRKRTR